MNFNLDRQVITIWAKQILTYINSEYPLAHLIIDNDYILEIDNIWVVKCQNEKFIKTNDIRYRLHAFPEPFLVIDKKDYNVYLVRDTDSEELFYDYKSFRNDGYCDVDFEEIQYSLVTSQILRNISSPNLSKQVSSVWQGSKCLRSVDELLFSNFSNLSKEEVLKIAEEAIKKEGFNKTNDSIKLAVSTIDSLGSVWIIGFQSETFLQSNKIQDMLMGNPIYLVDKQDAKIYSCGGASNQFLLEDFLHYKYGWYFEIQWKPINL